MNENTNTILTILEQNVQKHPKKRIFTFLENGEVATTQLTYQTLVKKSKNIATFLQKEKLTGERALLFFPQGLEFITAFFGCLYAGVIAVPSYPPSRNKMNRLRSIQQNCKAKIILSNQTVFGKSQKIAPDFFDTPWLLIDKLADTSFTPTTQIQKDSTAYLQYTSGSTGNPKGVMISHKNILHNAAFFKEVYDLSEKDCGVSWAPMFHDMGLVDGIFAPIYANYPLVLMSPYDFIQRPFRWLKAMSDYKATKSGGPNFAYDLCVEKITWEEIESLNLSQVKCLFNGAEPIRHSTHQQFLQKFKSTGIRDQVFNTGYGLAETTLQVIGVDLKKPPATLTLDKNALENNCIKPVSKTENGQTFVSSGYPRLGLSVKIVHPATFCLVNSNEVGEIWVKGDSVAQGYWENPEATTNTFNRTIVDIGETGYLRTGDLGFQYQGETYITGRIKDLIILNGKNYYPADIEKIIESAHPALAIGNTIAFSILAEKEKIVVVQGVKRTFFRHIDTKEVMTAIREKIAQTLEIPIHQIILVKPLVIPKTSSGKLMRQQCKMTFQQGNLPIIDQWSLSDNKKRETNLTSPAPVIITDEATLQKFLLQQISIKSGYALINFDQTTSILDLGLDSIKIVEIAASLEKKVHTEIEPSLFWEFKTIEKIAHFIFHQRMNTSYSHT